MNPFDTTGFPARWLCGSAWADQPWVGWLHIFSDLLIFLAYFAVPLVVLYFVRQRDDLRFPPIFYGFLGLIFFSCGTVHLIEACIFWWPAYKLSGLAKILTAVVSAIGVVLLTRVLPTALDLKSGAAYAQAVEERRKAQEKLTAEQFMLRTMLNNLPDLIYFKDTESRYTRVSAELAKFLGADSPESMVGKTDADFFPEKFAAEARADEIKVMEQNEPLIGKEELDHTRDGKEVWLSATKLPLHNDEGKLVGMFGLSRDITPQKQAAAVMAEAKIAAEEANRAKSEFLANMSHEIRTPMNGIMGMTQLLLATDLQKQQREYVNLIDQSSQSLLTIITDILDFSKIEAGKLEIDLHEFDLRDSIGDTLQTLEIRADQKNLELAYNVHPDVPDRLIGDLGRIRQILVNLVGNALKFTEKGEVVVNIGVDSGDGDGVLLHFSVKDTGIGISPENQLHIFESFTQAESSTTRTHGGTGLGLTISSKLVELMGGRIWVESQLGQGSTFHFTLRLRHGSPEMEVHRATPETLKGLSVLVVDDNSTNRRILSDILLNWEMAPRCAASGAEAIAMLAADAESSSEPIRLVLLDVMMPGMDGPEFIRRIRESYGDASPAILVLSSAAHSVSDDQISQLRIDRVLPKPIKHSDLFNAIADVFGMTAHHVKEAMAAPESRPAEIPEMKVLLAEDGRVNRLVAVKMLEARGHRVVTAEDGNEALAAHEKEPFDAILMDVQMPHLDGFAATRAIREREKQTGKHIAIIAMTANAMKGDREKCLEAGMDDYVAKPIKSQELIETLERQVQARPREAHSVPKDTEPGIPSAVEVWDLRKFEETIGEIELRRQLIEIFEDECGRIMAQIERATGAGDAKSLHTATHAFKGFIGNYSAPRTFQLASLIDTLAREGDVARVKEKLPAMKEEIRRLHQALLAAL